MSRSVALAGRYRAGLVLLRPTGVRESAVPTGLEPRVGTFGALLLNLCDETGLVVTVAGASSVSHCESGV
jgi:hypothetical protein